MCSCSEAGGGIDGLCDGCEGDGDVFLCVWEMIILRSWRGSKRDGWVWC